MVRKRNTQYSEEERKMILMEYKLGHMTQAEIAKKYDIGDRTMISVWLKKYGNPLQNAENFVSLQRQTQLVTEKMQQGSPEERILALEKQLKETENQLEAAEMKVKVLNTMIDIAERKGIKIRKNSGAKQ